MLLQSTALETHPSLDSRMLNGQREGGMACSRRVGIPSSTLDGASGNRCYYFMTPCGCDRLHPHRYPTNARRVTVGRSRTEK